MCVCLARERKKELWLEVGGFSLIRVRAYRYARTVCFLLSNFLLSDLGVSKFKQSKIREVLRDTKR